MFIFQFAILDLRFGGPELQDGAGTAPLAPPHSVLMEVLKSGSYYHSMFCDLFDFLGDIHTINKVRVSVVIFTASVY